jgi:hypothetical protein
MGELLRAGLVLQLVVAVGLVFVAGCTGPRTNVGPVFDVALGGPCGGSPCPPDGALDLARDSPPATTDAALGDAFLDIVAVDLDASAPADASTDQPPGADVALSDTVSPPATVCSTDNWCWDHPWPHGKNINSVWGTGETNVFAVAEGGTIFRYDGKQWGMTNTSTNAALRGIWGSGPSDVFAVGGKGTILHFDGQAWSIMTSNSTSDLNGVWGTSPKNVYAVGNIGTVRRFNGATWTSPVLLTTNFNAVWGSGASDVFLVGKGGAITHFDGASWANMASPVKNDLNAVWGSGPKDVYAVGEYGTMLHYNGSSWTQVGGALNSLKAVWGRSASEVYAAGSSGAFLCYDGNAWQSLWTCWPTLNAAKLPKEDLYGLWGVGATTLFAVGEAATLIRYLGAQEQLAPITKSTTQELHGIGGIGPSELYAVGESGTVLKKDLGTWNKVSSVTALMAPVLTDLIAFAPNDVLAIGYYCEIVHHDGVNWTKQPDWFSAGCLVRYSPEIWSSGQGHGFLLSYSSAEALFVGPGKTYVSNKLPTGGQNRGIWGTDFGNVYLISEASGAYGVFHWDGQSWSQMPGFPQYGQGLAIWGSSSSDIFVINQYPSGTLSHYDGSSWTQINPGAVTDLTRIWGSGPSDVYLVALDGSVLHYNGNAWKTMETGTNRRITDVWGLGATEVYLVGDSGAILRRSVSGTP